MIATVLPFVPPAWPPTSDAVPSSIAAPLDEPDAGRMLLTLLFTDIVAATATAERLGDRAWCALLLRHRSVVRAQLDPCHGHEINTMGDAFLIAFHRPSEALRFAVAVRAGLDAIGVPIRTGIHVGECAVTEGKVEGLAVHTAARIASAAERGEILVSEVVRELAFGSDFRFDARGPQALKGLSEQRRLYALQS